MERRTDAYLSTLENFVGAMGGHLEIYAVFGDGRIKLTHATVDDVRMNLAYKPNEEPNGEGHGSSEPRKAGTYRHGRR